MKRPTLVTVSNGKPENPFCTYDQFFDTARRFGYEPLVLGQAPGEFGGMGSKAKLLKRALSDNRVTSEHLVFCDAFDVVFQGDIAQGIDLLDFYKADILWNAEKNCYPDESLKETHPSTGTSFRFLNAGFAVGLTDAFVASLAEMNVDGLPDSGNDQDWWMRQHLFGKCCRSALDYQALLCMPVWGMCIDEIACGDGKVTCVETGNTPLAIHFNGSAKWSGLRDPVLKTIGCAL